MRVLLAIALLSFSIVRAQDEDSVYVYSEPYWPVTFESWDDTPYGCYMVAELLAEYAGNNDVWVVEQDFATFNEATADITDALYVLPGKDLYFRDVDWEAIKDFASRGNTVLMAVEVLPTAIQNELFVSPPSKKIEPYVKTVYGTPDSLSQWMFYYRQNMDLANRSWMFQTTYSNTKSDGFEILASAVDSVYQDTTGYDSENYSLCVLVRKKIGKGWLYFTSAPLLITNLALKSEAGFQYWNAQIADMHFTQVYWDEYIRLPYANLVNNYTSETPEGKESGNGPPQSQDLEMPNDYKSPLHFIISNLPLLLAYLLIITALLLFIIINSKRRMRPIPVAERRENTSLQFAETVARMYYVEGKHADLVKQQERIFMHNVRKRYRLDIRALSEADEQKLIQRSGQPADRISYIFNIFRDCRSGAPITGNQLEALYNNLLAFDQNTQKR
jgi:hypothetical protein